MSSFIFILPKAYFLIFTTCETINNFLLKSLGKRFENDITFEKLFIF